MNNYSWNLDDDYISHFGVGHKGNPPGRGSGRYPYGSSNNVKSVRDYTVRNHYQNVDGTITKKGLEVLKNKALGMDFHDPELASFATKDLISSYMQMQKSYNDFMHTLDYDKDDTIKREKQFIDKNNYSTFEEYNPKIKNRVDDWSHDLYKNYKFYSSKYASKETQKAYKQACDDYDKYSKELDKMFAEDGDNTNKYKNKYIAGMSIMRSWYQFAYMDDKLSIKDKLKGITIEKKDEDIPRIDRYQDRPSKDSKYVMADVQYPKQYKPKTIFNNHTPDATEEYRKNQSKVYKDIVDKDVIKKDTEFYRTANSGESIDSKRKYVSVLYDDAQEYDYAAMEGMLNNKLSEPMSAYTYKAKKDLKVATADKLYSDIINKYGDAEIKDLYKQTKSDYSKSKPLYERKDTDDTINKFVYDIATAKKEELAKHYSKNYDVMVDMEDYIGNSGMYPLILLKPINSVKLYYEDAWDEIYG